MKKIDSLETLREEQQALERQMEMTRHVLFKHTKVMGQQIKKDLVRKVLLPAGGTAALGLLLKQVLALSNKDAASNQVGTKGYNNAANWSRWINIGISLFRAWQKMNAADEHSPR